MNPLDYSIIAVDEITKIINKTEPDSFVNLSEEIMRAKKIYLCGAGRSGLVAKSFAMRLMHLGFEAYVVGETITPAIESDDLLVVISASGETKTLKVIKNSAKKQSSKIVLVTTQKKSSLGENVDLIAVIPGATDKIITDFHSKQPAGNSFEQSAFIILDGIIMWIANKMSIDYSDGFLKHSNLE